MAISWGAAGTAVYSTTDSAPGYPTGITVGDILLLLVGTKPQTSTNSAPGDWTSLLSYASTTGTTGIDTGPMRIEVWYKIADGSETGTITVTNDGNNSVSAAQILRVSKDAGVWEIAGATGEDTSGGTSWSATCSSNPGITSGDFLVFGGVIPTDVTTPSQFSAEAVTATGATIGTATEIGEWDTSSGQDMGGFMAYAAVTAGTASAAPVVTATAGGTTTNVYGPSYVIRLRENDSATNASAQTATVTSAAANATGDNGSAYTAPTLVGYVTCRAGSTPWADDSTGTVTGTINGVLTGDIIVMVGASEQDVSTGVLNAPNAVTGVSSWTPGNGHNTQGIGNTCVQFWTATATSDGNKTFTADYTNGNRRGYGVWVWRGSDGIGAAPSYSFDSNQSPDKSITTTQDNSAVVYCGDDYNASDGASRSILSNTTEDDYGYVSGGHTVYVGHAADVGAAGTYTVGWSAPTTAGPITDLILEIKGTSSGAPETEANAQSASVGSATADPGTSTSPTVQSADVATATADATTTGTSSTNAQAQSAEVATATADASASKSAQPIPETAAVGTATVDVGTSTSPTVEAAAATAATADAGTSTSPTVGVAEGTGTANDATTGEGQPETSIFTTQDFSASWYDSDPSSSVLITGITFTVSEATTSEGCRYLNPPSGSYWAVGEDLTRHVTLWRTDNQTTPVATGSRVQHEADGSVTWVDVDWDGGSVQLATGYTYMVTQVTPTKANDGYYARVDTSHITNGILDTWETGAWHGWYRYSSGSTPWLEYPTDPWQTDYGVDIRVGGGGTPATNAQAGCATVTAETVDPGTSTSPTVEAAQVATADTTASASKSAQPIPEAAQVATADANVTAQTAAYTNAPAQSAEITTASADASWTEAALAQAQAATSSTATVDPTGSVGAPVQAASSTGTAADPGTSTSPTVEAASVSAAADVNPTSQTAAYTNAPAQAAEVASATADASWTEAALAQVGSAAVGTSSTDATADKNAQPVAQAASSTTASADPGTSTSPTVQAAIVTTEPVDATAQTTGATQAQAEAATATSAVVDALVVTEHQAAAESALAASSGAVDPTVTVAAYAQAETATAASSTADPTPMVGVSAGTATGTSAAADATVRIARMVDAALASVVAELADAGVALASYPHIEAALVGVAAAGATVDTAAVTVRRPNLGHVDRPDDGTTTRPALSYTARPGGEAP